MSRTKRRRRRRNPNLPTLEGLKTSAMGVLNVENLTQAAWIGASGAIAVGVLSKVLPIDMIPAGINVAGFDVSGLLVSLAVGVVTGVVGGVVAGFLPGQVGNLVGKFAVAGSQGALIFGLASFLAPLTSRATALVPGAGYGAFEAERFDEAGRLLAPSGSADFGGYDPEGRWVANPNQPEYVRMDDVVPTITPRQLKVAQRGTLGSYERLGDIYGSQRLGSFEREVGLGGYCDETDPACGGIIQEALQQPADTAAAMAAGIPNPGAYTQSGPASGYGSYETFGAPGQVTGASDFTPLWS